MDLVALVTLCSVMFDPGVMHALVIAEREGNPRSFRGVDDVLRSLARTGAVMRVPEAEMTTVRVDLADLAVDPEAASAQPIEGVLESSLGVPKPAVLGTPPHPSNGARPPLITRTSTLRIGRFSVP